MFKKIANKAKNLKVDIKTKISDTKQTAENIISSSKNRTNKIIEKKWQSIEKIVVEKLLTLAENNLNNDKNLKAMFKKVYEMLPIAIRLAVPADKFVGFCMIKKEPILNKISAYKNEKSNKIVLPKMPLLT